MSPVSKWLVFPKLVTGKKLDINSQAFKAIDRLFKLRNAFVHYKTQKIKATKYSKVDWGKPDRIKKRAEDALDAVYQAVTELAKIDLNVSKAWLVEDSFLPDYYPSIRELFG